MCQRRNTGESNNFYFGIFICIGPFNVSERGIVLCRKKFPNLSVGFSPVYHLL